MMKQLLPGCLFLVLGLCRYAVLGHSTINDSPETVPAWTGGHAVLPCQWDKSFGEVVQVEWSKEGLNPNVVLLYRHGCETHAQKHPDYEFRSNLFMKELQRRNISLRISNVQPSDEGTYHCRIFRQDYSHMIIKTVNLTVDAAFQSNVSITTKSGSGGVSLHCEATCWFPKPEVEWLDDQGKVIKGEVSTDPNVSACYTVRSSVTLQKTATNRFTCRVRQPEINHTRNTEIVISGDYAIANTRTTTICSLVPLFALGVGIVLGFLCAMKTNTAGILTAQRQTRPTDREPPCGGTESSSTSAGEKSLLLEPDGPLTKSNQNLPTTTARQNSQQNIHLPDLQSQLHVKEDTVAEQPDQQRSLEKKRPHHSVCQFDRPPMVCNSTNSPRNEAPISSVLGFDTDPIPRSLSYDKSAKSAKPLPHINNLAHSNGPRHSTTSLPIAAAGSTDSDSASPSCQKPNIRGRTKSFSLTGPNSPVRHSRISSFSIPVSNTYSALAETDES